MCSEQNILCTLNLGMLLSVLIISCQSQEIVNCHLLWIDKMF